MSRFWRGLGIASLTLVTCAFTAAEGEHDPPMWPPMTFHRTVGPVGGRAPLPAAESEARTAGDPATKRMLINACAGKDSPAYWVENLRHPDPATRVLAAQALGETRDSTVVPVLLSTLKDPDRAVRVAAVRALGRIGPGARAAAPILREMLAGKDEGLRDEASRSLEKIAAANRK